MSEPRGVTISDLNRASCRALQFMGRQGLEVEIHDGRITRIAKSPDREAIGEKAKM